jgi:hypothetical protein
MPDGKESNYGVCLLECINLFGHDLALTNFESYQLQYSSINLPTLSIAVTYSRALSSDLFTVTAPHTALRTAGGILAEELSSELRIHHAPCVRSRLTLR